MKTADKILIAKEVVKMLDFNNGWVSENAFVDWQKWPVSGRERTEKLRYWRNHNPEFFRKLKDGSFAYDLKGYLESTNENIAA